MLLRVLALAAVVSAELPSVTAGRPSRSTLRPTCRTPRRRQLHQQDGREHVRREGVLLDAPSPRTTASRAGAPSSWRSTAGPSPGRLERARAAVRLLGVARLRVLRRRLPPAEGPGAYPGSIAWWPALTVPRAAGCRRSARCTRRRATCARRCADPRDAGEYGGDARVADDRGRLGRRDGGDGDRRRRRRRRGRVRGRLHGRAPRQDHAASTHLRAAPTVTGFIDYWGGLFAVDAMTTKDGASRWSSASPPTIAFHGTNDDGRARVGRRDVLDLTAPRRASKSTSPARRTRADATVELDDGSKQSIFDYAFDFMAGACGWSVIETATARPPRTRGSWPRGRRRLAVRAGPAFSQRHFTARHAAPGAGGPYRARARDTRCRLGRRIARPAGLRRSRRRSRGQCDSAAAAPACARAEARSR